MDSFAHRYEELISHWGNHNQAMMASDALQSSDEWPDMYESS